jgi:hypothetical protein
MRSLGTRRAAWSTGVAVVAAMALTGCGAGQISETANIVPATDGVNTSNSDSSVSIRNLLVAYPGVKGYPAGGSAPLEVVFYNETTQPLTVTVASRPAAEAGEDVVYAQSVNLVGSTPSAAQTSGVPAEVEPSGTRPPAVPQPAVSNEGGQPTTSASVPAEPTVSVPPQPSAGAPAAGQPAKITMAALGSATFRADDAQSLQLVGLSGPLLPGTSANLVFTFSNGAAPLTVQAPVAMPLSPAPRGSAEVEPISEAEDH